MKSTDLLEQKVQLEESGRAPQDTDYTLSVAVVYQDALAQEWASQVCARARQLVGDDCLQSHWWHSELLQKPAALAEAVNAACLADVIVVAVQAAAELPVDLCVWIDAWLPRRGRKSGALVALIGVPDPTPPGAALAHDYLLTVARKAGLDFLPHEQTVPSKTPRVYVQPNPQRANPTSRALQYILDEGRLAYRHWGINE